MRNALLCVFTVVAGAGYGLLYGAAFVGLTLATVARVAWELRPRSASVLVRWLLVALLLSPLLVLAGCASCAPTAHSTGGESAQPSTVLTAKQ